MATELENLVVRIQADVSEMKAGMKEAHESVEGLKTAMEALGVYAGIELVRHLVEVGAEIGRLEKITGQSAESLQELRFAATQLDVSQESLNQGLAIFNRNIGQAETGNIKAASAFGALGISLQDQHGKLKTSEELFRQVGDSISKMGSSQEQALIAQELFGRGGLQLLPMLTANTEKMDALRERARELGIVLDENLIKDAENLKAKFESLALVSETRLMKAVLELAPAISWVAEKMAAAAESTAYLTKLAVDATSAFANMEWSSGSASKAVAKMTEADFEAALAAEHVATGEKKATASIADRIKIAQEAEKLLNAHQSGNKGEQLNEEIATLKKFNDFKTTDHDRVVKVIQQKETELTKFQQAENLKKVQNLMKENDALISTDRVKYATRIADNQMAIDIMTSAEAVGSDKINLLKAEQLARAKKYREEEVKAVESSLSNISVLSNAKSKELAAIGKAAAVANATIHTYEAANLALATIPPPFGFAVAATEVVAGLANVANITGVGFASGADMIPGSGNSDSYPAMVMPGERIVKTETNQVLEQFLQDYKKGGGSAGGGTQRIEFFLKGDLANWIDAKLVERKRLGYGVAA